MAVGDRSQVFEVNKIGVEAIGAEGVAVPATRLLQAMHIELATDAEIDIYGPMGQKFDTLSILNKEWTGGAITGKPTYDELVYPLASVLCNPTISTPGGGTLSRQWDFAPSSTGPDVVRTFTAEQGPRGGAEAERATNLVVRGLGLTFSRNSGTDMTGEAIAKALTQDVALSGNEVQQVAITGTPTGGTFTLTFSGQTTAGIAYNANAAAVQSALEALSNIAVGDVNVTGGALPGTPVLVEFRGVYAETDVGAMTASGAGLTGGTAPAVAITTPTPGVAATAVPMVPISPTQISVYLDDTAGAIGTTKLLRDFEVGWEIGDRHNPIYALNAAITSFDGTIEGRPTNSVRLKMGNNAVARALLTTMRAGATKYLRVEAVGPTIEGSITHRFRLDAALIVAEAPDRGDEDVLVTLEWVFRLRHDATWGKAMSVQLINTTTAL